MIYGRGRLLLDGEDVGEVEYKLEISRPSGSGRGFLYGRTEVIMETAFANDVKVKRGDVNFTMSLAVSTVDAEGRAQVLTSGDPGPDTAGI